MTQPRDLQKFAGIAAVANIIVRIMMINSDIDWSNPLLEPVIIAKTAILLLTLAVVAWVLFKLPKNMQNEQYLEGLRRVGKYMFIVPMIQIGIIIATIAIETMTNWLTPTVLLAIFPIVGIIWLIPLVLLFVVDVSTSEQSNIQAILVVLLIATLFSTSTADGVGHFLAEILDLLPLAIVYQTGKMLGDLIS